MFTNDDLIFSYTRAQAIADGVLMDITEQAKGFGFKLPMALTDAVYTKAVEWTEADSDRKPGLGQSTDGRLNDLLTMSYLAARDTDDNRAPFRVLVVPRFDAGETAEELELVLHIGPGDRGEPVLTIMLPDED